MNYYEPATSVDTTIGFVGALGVIIYLIALIISLIRVISLWKIFVKCGKPGWAAIIPIYNIIVLLEIVGKGPITILLLCIPFYQIYVTYKIYEALALKLGKSSGFAILLLLFPYIGLPILAFSKNVQPVMPVVEPMAPAAPVMPAVEPVAPVAPVMPAVEPVAPVAPVMPANSIEGQNPNGQF